MALCRANEFRCKMKWLVLCVCLCACSSVLGVGHESTSQKLVEALDLLEAKDEIQVVGGVSFRRVENLTEQDSGRSGSVEDEVLQRLKRLSRTHVLDVKVPELVNSARMLATNNLRKYLSYILTCEIL